MQEEQKKSLPIYESLLPFIDIADDVVTNRTSSDSLLPIHCIATPKISINKKVNSFSEKTLIYIFYSMPHDQIQKLAITTLYSKGWIYDLGSKTWIKRDDKAPFLCFNPVQWCYEEKYIEVDKCNILNIEELE